MNAEEIPSHEQYIVDVLLNCASGGTVSKDRNPIEDTPGGVQPCPPGEKSTPLVVSVLLKTIEAISHLGIYLPKEMRSEGSRVSVWKSVLEVQARFPEGMPLLDPVENMRIEDDKFKALVGVRSPATWHGSDF